MGNSHAAHWASEAPTPAQLKEFFAQIESGRVTRSRLQSLLRGESFSDVGLSILCDGSRKASQLIKAGGYDWHNDWITDERFPIKKHSSVRKTIEYVTFNHDPSSEEALEEFRKRGLQRPSYEDALRFGAQHKEEQRNGPIVFLHEPVLAPDGSRFVLVLDGGAGLRSLFLGWFDYRWPRGYRVAGVRES